jgi:NAD(P)-dependent dehydrogenase (short-subunit alcohol dehydrogenase family)
MALMSLAIYRLACVMVKRAETTRETAMAGRLEGKVAVITGAASGIGRGTVELFVAEGARVIAADIQDDKGARMEEDHKGKVRYVRCDVSKEADIAAAVAAAVKHFGKLTTIFNNAGTGGAPDTAEGVTAEGFDSVMHLHIRAALFGMKYAVPEMKKAGGGSIISTASVAGLQAGFGPILYSIAKAGIIHMSKIAATQLAPYNIRVNAICPGLIATNIFAQAFGIPSQLAETRVDAIAEASKNSQPIQRGGRPRDIAETALFLASDGSDWMTGQALVMDGGLTLGPASAQEFGVFMPIVQALGVDAEALAQMAAGQFKQP